jgi:hypothetical protein
VNISLKSASASGVSQILDSPSLSWKSLANANHANGIKATAKVVPTSALDLGIGGSQTHHPISSDALTQMFA